VICTVFHAPRSSFIWSITSQPGYQDAVGDDVGSLGKVKVDSPHPFTDLDISSWEAVKYLRH